MIPRLAAALCAIWFALPALATIDIEEVTSPGGIEAWLVEDHSIPFVALEFWFVGGSALDAPEARGATYLMMGLLEEGAADMDAQAFAAEVEGLATAFSFDAAGDAVTVSARMLTQNRTEAADLLRAALVEPRFDEDAIERVRGQVLSIIEGNARNPSDIARTTFNAMAYGDHPYGTPQEGSVDSVTALTRDDILAAHRAALTRDRVVVGAAGDITAEELGALIDRILGDLPAEAPPRPDPVTLDLPGGITVVDFPSPQSVAFFGHAGIDRDDPDFFAAFVLNQVLGGGGFRSRLMEEVRVARGLTYGIGSFLSLADLSPAILGQFSSSNELVAEAIEVVRAEWSDLAQNGITEEELEAAKRYMTGEYPLRFDGNGTIAGILASMQSDDMPVDYITNRNSYIEAVTLEDVRRVAARLLDPEALHFVVVGQPQNVSPGN
ncbi:M16 family metallopeptidase [Roseicyclus marinus]|uniref:M16 family metallopeptidase n=1 Tax=Roseicyclus marinus TaxID=2161673 RepID=UPI00240ED12A|nr:pitrilysin family protein [Roseicyclus marinus]MDG3041048.1 pitrilysin family protein [Roseicyclus marinus]